VRVHRRGDDVELCAMDAAEFAFLQALADGAPLAAALERAALPVDRLAPTLAALFAELPEPLLIHCKSGADRTGLVAGIWLLLQGRPVQAALDQLHWRFGHLSASKTGILDAFFQDYAAFQARHGAKPFLAWLREDYDEDDLRARFRSKAWADRIVDGVLRRE
jgi:hypothetical protein